MAGRNGQNAKQNRERTLREGQAAMSPKNMVHPEERLLAAEFIEGIRENGLIVDDFPVFVRDHIGYPSGYLVFLPESNGGNGLVEYEAHFLDSDGQDRITRMPSLTLWGDESNWNIEVHEWVPGPGPGDFSKRFTSLDEALENILSYFFDPNDHSFKQAEHKHLDNARKRQLFS
jgi:hypothetical protein